MPAPKKTLKDYVFIAFIIWISYHVLHTFFNVLSDTKPLSLALVKLNNQAQAANISLSTLQYQPQNMTHLLATIRYDQTYAQAADDQVCENMLGSLETTVGTLARARDAIVRGGLTTVTASSDFEKEARAYIMGYSWMKRSTAGRTDDIAVFLDRVATQFDALQQLVDIIEWVKAQQEWTRVGYAMVGKQCKAIGAASERISTTLKADGKGADVDGPEASSVRLEH